MKTAVFLILAAGLAGAEEPGLPALTGIKRIEQRFGAEFVARVFEMTGVSGDPQPTEWRVTTHDPIARTALHEFWIGGRRVSDEGLNDDYYPERLPKGFLNPARLRIDSPDAFSIAESKAREARVGFDLVNYKLHCREYTDEPIWTLTLLDREEEIVGSVHLSGESGRVLRTVWIRRPGGRLAVADSALGAPLGSRTVAGRRAGEDSPDYGSRSEFGVADEEPIDDPDEPEAERPVESDRPAEEPQPDAGSEIPEIKRLNEAQEQRDRKQPE